MSEDSKAEQINKIFFSIFGKLLSVAIKHNYIIRPIIKKLFFSCVIYPIHFLGHLRRLKISKILVEYLFEKAAEKVKSHPDDEFDFEDIHNGRYDELYDLIDLAYEINIEEFFCAFNHFDSVSDDGKMQALRAFFSSCATWSSQDLATQIKSNSIIIDLVENVSIPYFKTILNLKSIVKNGQIKQNHQNMVGQIINDMKKIDVHPSLFDERIKYLRNGFAHNDIIYDSEKDEYSINKNSGKEILLTGKEIVQIIIEQFNLSQCLSNYRGHKFHETVGFTTKKDILDFLEDVKKIFLFDGDIENIPDSLFESNFAFFMWKDKEQKK